MATGGEAVQAAPVRRYDVGTPLGGERKQRRMRSPLQEMDDMPNSARNLFDEPVTPPGNEPDTPHGLQPAVTVDAITEAMSKMLEKMLDEKLSEKLDPVTNVVEAVNQKVDQVTKRVDDITDRIQKLETEGASKSEVGFNTLEKKVGEIENIIATWTPTPTPLMTPRTRETTAVVGGLSSLKSL